MGFISHTSINIFLRAAQSQHKEPALTNRRKYKQSPVARKYLRLVLIKDAPWWLLSEEVSVPKKSHTLHSCLGPASGLCLRGAAGLLRKLAAALQTRTEIRSSWSRRFSLLWTLSLSSLSTTSPCIRCLSTSHTASYTDSHSAQAPRLTLLTVSPQPQGLSFIACTRCWMLGFFCCASFLLH